MSELVDFLRARLDEDEAAARGVNRGLWNSRVALLDPDLYGHVIRQHPARVMAEVEAKRRIVEIHREGDPDKDWRFCEQCSEDERLEPFPCATVRLLALPYADHPDCREEWRP